MATRTMKRAQGKAKTTREAKADAVARAEAIAPSVEVRMGSTPATKYRSNRDIFGRLVEDHDRYRALLAMIEETQGKSADRQALFKELVREVKSHAAAEEQALWSSVLRNPKTTEFARHAIAEHKELDDMLADLAARDMASPGWLKRCGETKDEYLHHVREEEQEQFVAAEKSLSATDARYLRRVFNRRKKRGKGGCNHREEYPFQGLKDNMAYTVLYYGPAATIRCTASSLIRRKKQSVCQ